MERRNFLRALTFTAAATTAAEALIAQKGGAVNVIKSATPEQIERARKAVENDAIVRGPRSQYMEVKEHALYDVLDVRPDQHTPEYFPFFAYPIGSYPFGGDCSLDRNPSWGVKTLLDTNSLRGNQLPPPRAMYVKRIFFLFSPNSNPEDCQEFASRYFFEFRLMDKVAARAPLAFCPVAGELEALFDFEESGTERTGLTRYPKARNRAEVPAPQCITLEKPIFIEPLMQFCFDVHGKEFRPAKRLRVYAMLDGAGTFETV